jgi:peptidoglycan/LPS O-acetylase OafA/YrhL
MSSAVPCRRTQSKPGASRGNSRQANHSALMDQAGTFQPGLCAFLATDLLVVALAAMLFYIVERPVRARLRDRMGSFKKA